MDVRYRTRREIRKCEAALGHRLVQARRDWNRRLRRGDAALSGGGEPRKTHNTGINYWGSKRRIAPEIVRHILPAFSKKRRTFAEPFCGTAYVSAELMAHRRGIKYILSDVNPHMIALLSALRGGWSPTYQRITQKTRDRWKQNKHVTNPSKTFYGIIHGFGGMFLNGSKPRLCPGSSTDSKQYVMLKINALKDTHGHMRSVRVLHKSYDRCDYKNTVIYCDPPYVCDTSSNARCWDAHEYHTFLSRVHFWLKPSKNNRVFLSGSFAPPGHKGLRKRRVWSSRMYTPQSSKKSTGRRNEYLWEYLRNTRS